MHGISISRTGLFCLLALVITGSPQAAPSFSFGFNTNSQNSNPRTTTNRPWGNIGTYKPGIKIERNFNNTGNGYTYSYSYSYGNASDPASSGYYLGGAPGTGWPTTSNLAGRPYSTSPYAAQMPQPSVSAQPRVEVGVSETNPYEQQNVVYTVHVVSNNNLKILNPILPTPEGAALEIVDGPVPSARKAGRNGATEIVNTYRIKLTPLRSGEVVIPPIRFKGTQVATTNRQWGMRPGASGAGDEPFDISSGKPLTLRVKPADPAVEPWLPLQDLQLQTSLQGGQPGREGIPVTLTIDLGAKGALGDQLPSLESQLKSRDFRVYRESTTTKKGVSNNGKYLIGSRHETYTLIPLKDGPIRLPRLGVAWWDVNRHIPQIAGEADRPGYASARDGKVSPDPGDSSPYPAYFWFPLLITVGLITGYWLGAWARTRPVVRSTVTAAVHTLKPLKMQMSRAVRSVKHSLSLNRYLNVIRMSVASVMPMQIKLWMCTRCVEQENNPGEWCYNFKTRICQHLGISSHTPLPEVAEKLIDANPHLEPDKIRAMVRSLDAAMYGGEQLDFMAWKRDLSNQLRPRARRRKRFSLRTKTTLPELNPRSA